MASVNIGWLWDATPYVRADYNISTGAGTDNGPLLSQAISDALTYNWRGIWIPPGFYKVATTIVIPSAGKTTFEIQGAGGYTADGTLFNPPPPMGVNLVCTGLLCTAGQPAFDVDGASRLVFGKLAFEGWATASGGNTLPQYFIRIQNSGTAAVSGLQQLIEDCFFADGIEGIRYGEPGQSHCARLRIVRTDFRNLLYCLRSRTTSSVLNVMEDCTTNGLGTVAWLENGGAFHAKRLSVSGVGYGAPPLAGDPYWVPANHTTTFNPYGDGTTTYWAFVLGAGDPTAATVILEGLRGEQGTGQYIYCPGAGSTNPPKHVVEIINLDDTASAASTAQLFNIAAGSSCRLNFREGRINVGSGTPVGTGSTTAIVVFDGTEFAALPAATVTQPSNVVNFCRYFNGTQMTTFSSSTL